MILLSTFTSIQAFASSFLVPQFLVRDPFDNLAVVQSFDGPTLVAHGEEDRIVPYAHGQALHRAAKRGKMLSYASGHNDCPPDWDAFVDEIMAFLQEEGVVPPNRPNGG